MAQIEPRITMGNVLGLTATIITFGCTLAAVSSWTGQQGQRIEANERALQVTATTILAHESRLRQVENSSARQDERLLLILESVRKIESTLEKRSR